MSRVRVVVVEVDHETGIAAAAWTDARLTFEAAQAAMESAVIRLNGLGVSEVQLADEFGLNRMTIRRILGKPHRSRK